MALKSKTSVWLICGIMAAVVSAFFPVLETTPLFIEAYLFAILGIAALGFGSVYLMRSGKSYPWFAAFPFVTWTYLVVQILFSALFLTIENLFNWSFPITWFSLVHILMLTIVAIILIALNFGKGYIDARGAAVREKVIGLKMLVADLDTASDKLPSMKDEIKAAADALRYSDPMSSPTLAEYENAMGIAWLQ